MATEKLYQKNVYAKEAVCRVETVRSLKGVTQVSLDGTIFFPGGGGQPCDLGTIGGVQITDVREEDGAIWHSLEKPVDFTPGQEVRCLLDWQRRFDHMQMHCGEHILSGRFYALFGAENRGFHMGEDYMTIDLAMEGGRPLNSEMLARAQLACNEIIWSDAPVETLMLQSKGRANAHPLRKALQAEEDIAVVYIGGREHPADCCACCGTHPATAGQVGLVLILKSENYKGMTRLTIKAGRHAFLEAASRAETVSLLAKKYSCEPAALLEREAANEAKNSETRKELSRIKSYLANREEEKLKAQLPLQNGSIAVFRYELQSAEELQSMARKLETHFTRPTALFSLRDRTIVLASPGTPGAGQMVRDYAPMYGGKGGGNDKLARAIFPRESDGEIFLDLLEKHLR